jgi:hypothetical protein
MLSHKSCDENERAVRSAMVLEVLRNRYDRLLHNVQLSFEHGLGFQTIRKHDLDRTSFNRCVSIRMRVSGNLPSPIERRCRHP